MEHLEITDLKNKKDLGSGEEELSVLNETKGDKQMTIQPDGSSGNAK